MRTSTWTFLIATLFAGCGSSAVPVNTDAAPAPDDGAASDTSPLADAAPPQPDAGPQPIWPDDAVRLVADDSGGGFGPAPPPGSTCTPGESHYTVTVADKKLAWRLCRSTVQAQPQSPLAIRTGERILGDADFQRLVGTLRKLTLVTDNRCGADKPALSLTVTTPRGDTRYRDAFYKCGNQSDLWADEDPVFEVLRSLEPAG